jgi:hypothetical protein
MAIPVFPGEVPGSGVIFKRGMIPALPIRDSIAAWFRYGRGISADGSNLVSQWDDVSGNGRHLKQGTASNKPALQPDGSILFDGVDNFMKCDAFTLVQPITIYALFKTITATSNDTIYDGNAGNTMRLYQPTNSSPNLTSTANGTSLLTAPLAIGEYGVTCAVYNGNSGVLQINNGTPQAGAVGAGNGGGFQVGVFGNGIGNFSHIEVKEFILYTAAHDVTQRASVSRYLARVGKVVF